MKQFFSQLEHRSSRGWRNLQCVFNSIDWKLVLVFISLIVLLPVVIPTIIIGWPIAYIVEYRENKRDGVRSVR